MSKKGIKYFIKTQILFDFLICALLNQTNWYVNDTFVARKMKKTTINTTEFRSLCPVATGLDILGDKWTLLILRDMIWGHKSLFNEFKESPENMPSKMLSNRLKKLEAFGFISKKAGITNKKMSTI